MEARDSCDIQYLLNRWHPAVQPWSMGDHFPAIIARVERCEVGVVLETYHEVILKGEVREFHGTNTYDQAHAWAMEQVHGH